MKYFYDTEFVERGPGFPIDLISIGIVDEQGHEYYAQCSEFHLRAAERNKFVKDEVLLSLDHCPYVKADTLRVEMWRHRKGQCCYRYINNPKCPWRTRAQIKEDIVKFMDPRRYGTPELWAWYAAYDHVVFAQIFGTMMDLPDGFPMWTNDVKQYCSTHIGIDEELLPHKNYFTEHNALVDAKWTKSAYEFLAKCKVIE